MPYYNKEFHSSLIGNHKLRESLNQKYKDVVVAYNGIRVKHVSIITREEGYYYDYPNEYPDYELVNNGLNRIDVVASFKTGEIAVIHNSDSNILKSEHIPIVNVLNISVHRLDNSIEKVGVENGQE